MQLPPMTDLVAMLGINLVLCAACARLLCRGQVFKVWMRWVLAAIFIALCLPVGPAHIPALAYMRGVSSDLSVTLVLLACVALVRRLRGLPMLARSESTSVFVAVAAAALLLYPAALGWGDLDSYRAGFGSPTMLLALLVLCVACWWRGLKLLPLLVSAALLAWAAGLMESTNLWDYLMDPWLAASAFVECLRAGVTRLRQRGKPVPGKALALNG
ncbi:MAG: hypothetical protein V4451_13960 [Pseudomonadota bacterium]